MDKSLRLTFLPTLYAFHTTRVCHVLPLRAALTTLYTCSRKQSYRIIVYTLCLKKNIPDVINCNLKRDDPILIIFGTNIDDTTGHQMTVNVPTLPNVCFCTPWEKQNKRNMR